MKNFMFIIILLISVIFQGCSVMPSKEFSKKEIQKTVSRIENSKIIVLDIFHDRCESCKSIEPVMEKLKSEYLGNSDLVFLKYDLSNPITVLRSRKIAKAAGLENIYKSQRFSGIVLIINSKTKEVIDTLIGEYDIQKYYGAIQKDLAAINAKVATPVH